MGEEHFLSVLECEFESVLCEWLTYLIKRDTFIRTESEIKEQQMCTQKKYNLLHMISHHMVLDLYRKYKAVTVMFTLLKQVEMTQ